MINSIVVRTAAESRDLTDLATVKDVLGISGAEKDAQLQRIIKSASRRIEDFTERVFARELLTEKLGVDIGTAIGSYADSPTTRLMLERIPILVVEAVRFDGDVIDIDTIVVEDPEAGFLFRDEGFTETLIEHQAIERTRTRVLEQLWEVDYSAGYVLPSFGAINFSFEVGDVNTTDDTITETGHKLVNGDPVRFTTTGTLPAGLTLNRDFFVRDAAANTFKVASERGGVAVDLTSAGSGTHTVERQRTLPESIEEAAIELSVAMFRRQGQDLNIKSERLGDYQVTYADPADVIMSGGLPPSIMSQLEHWRRLD